MYAYFRVQDAIKDATGDLVSEAAAAGYKAVRMPQCAAARLALYATAHVTAGVTLTLHVHAAVRVRVTVRAHSRVAVRAARLSCRGHRE